jgi:hypothetical protein
VANDPGTTIACKDLFALRNRAASAATALIGKAGLSLAGRKSQRDANREREQSVANSIDSGAPVNSLFA